MWDIHSELEVNEKEREAVEIKAKEVNAWFTKCFATEAGEKVLDYLKSHTLDKPCFLPGQSHDIGIWREGQDNLVREILARIEKGKKGEV
jgi:hypothetical protein